MVLRAITAASDPAWCAPTGRFIEFLFAIALEDVTADFLGKIFTAKICAALLRLVTISGPCGPCRIGLLDPAVFQQPSIT